jgi:hypothetical protein
MQPTLFPAALDTFAAAVSLPLIIRPLSSLVIRTISICLFASHFRFASHSSSSFDFPNAILNVLRNTVCLDDRFLVPETI